MAKKRQRNPMDLLPSYDELLDLIAKNERERKFLHGLLRLAFRNERLVQEDKDMKRLRAAFEAEMNGQKPAT